MPVSSSTAAPLHIIGEMFAAKEKIGPGWEARVVEHFTRELDRPGVTASLPSLNLVPNHGLADGQLARFRCVVQDMFDPEFYLEEYRVAREGGAEEARCGRYRDTLQCGLGERLLESGQRTGDRLCLYCVSPPGEAAWARDQFRQLAGPAPGPSGVSLNSHKRPLEEAEEEMEAEDGAGEAGSKKVRAIGATVAGTVTPKSDLNLPLPSPHGRAAVVKLYDLPEGEIKVNDTLEVVGLVSLDPVLAGEEESEAEMSVTPQVGPPSLVPRLHVLTYTRTRHNNPLLPLFGPLPAAQPVARVELHTILTACMLGDTLAADFLLLHLISRVYLRRDVLVLGKLSLNLHGLAGAGEWSRRLATVLSLLTPQSHYLPLTRETLQHTAFQPKKDFEANRLVAGQLQLPAGTHLWLDETVMTNGQLDATGLRNLTTLGNLITWQRLEYDFQFQTLEYDTDLPCLVMSEGRSMLPSDAAVLVQPKQEATAEQISSTFVEIGKGLCKELLDRVRQFLTICRLAEYQLTDQVVTAVQEDFVSLRQSEAGITGEDFHALLVLGRLISLSQGRTSLTPEDWEEAKRMERERKARAAALPSRGAAQANGMPLHL